MLRAPRSRPLWAACGGAAPGSVPPGGAWQDVTGDNQPEAGSFLATGWLRENKQIGRRAVLLATASEAVTRLNYEKMARDHDANRVTSRPS